MPSALPSFSKLTFLAVLVSLAIFVYVSASQYTNVRDIGIYFCSHFIPFEKRKLASKHCQDIANNYEQGNKKAEDNVIIFLGDSHIKNFSLPVTSLDGQVVNRGSNGDTTVGVLNRLDKNVNNVHAKRLFLMIGYNDIKFRGVDNIVTNYRSILKRLSVNSVYVFSLLPVAPKRTWVNSRIKVLNKEIEKLTNQFGFEFIDLYPEFVNPESFGIKKVYELDGHSFK